MGTQHVLLSSHKPQKHPWLCPHNPTCPPLIDSLSPSLTSHNSSAINTLTQRSILSTRHPPKLLFPLFFPLSTTTTIFQKLLVSLALLYPFFYGDQESKQAISKGCDQANSQEVFELGQKTKLRRTRPPFGRPKRPLCCLRWWEQKQIHRPDIFLDSTWVSKLAPSSRRRIRLRSRYGSNHPLWRSRLPVFNIKAHIIIMRTRSTCKTQREREIRRLGAAAFFF